MLFATFTAGTPQTSKILLVDDERDITTVFKAGLERTGAFSVDVFDDPNEAAATFKPNHYHAIVLDIRMPGMSGFQLARALWEKDQSARICFLSAFEIYQQEAEKVFRDFGQHCFITKPISVSALAQHLEEHLLKNEGSSRKR